MSGRQCVKRLWFEVNQPPSVEVPPSVPMLQGQAFDELVQQPEPGIIISRVHAATASGRPLLDPRCSLLAQRAAIPGGEAADTSHCAECDSRTAVRSSSTDAAKLLPPRDARLVVVKKVLPTIDATLAYEDLGEIGAGDAAQQAVLEWRDPKSFIERRQALVEGLKRYGERDTWAMVVLGRFLSGEGAGPEAG